MIDCCRTERQKEENLRRFSQGDGRRQEELLMRYFCKLIMRSY
jgi:hypothetical protein